MGTLQKLQNSIQTPVSFWPVYPIHTNSLFWVIFVELPFCHFAILLFVVKTLKYSWSFIWVSENNHTLSQSSHVSVMAYTYMLNGYQFILQKLWRHLVRLRAREYWKHRPFQKRERTGKEYGCFPFVWKTKIFKWKVNYILESLPRIEAFGEGKWQNGSSTNITQNREFVWIG